MTGERDLVGPAIELALEVIERAKGPQRQKARLEVADHALDLAFGLRLAGIQHHRQAPEVSEQGSDLVVQTRRCARSPGLDDRGVVVHHELLGDTSEAFETSNEALEKIGVLLWKLNTTAWAAQCGRVATKP